ncbi:NAD(P)H-binding protein [Pseudodesulfovibrio sp. JC047]|uniref:NmrA family NAD(P)-binding protein n=1 Tax=Pseudodesulfovibrio sp. JC047 TaxID=2683199 RepID=UPI0013D20E4E|nr:NmrA family NAD(P)-binding protein [Pseudodesulfovibrio sp. JC047]NDV20133.1 NAD(P)H-binding protein [Pseudodesulfovibrio sp. JC047]
MSKIFIPSGAGLLGTALIDSLDGRAEVVAGVHSQARADALANSGVEARVFDFKDVNSIARVMAGCDRVFLSIPMQEKLSRYGHLTVEAAKKAGIEYIVRSSGYGASSDAHWRLGREHGMVDQFVEDSKITYTVLRPNCFMQNFIGPYAEMVRAGVIALPQEAAAVSYIDVRDVTDCAARLLLDNTGFENSFYALTGPEGLTLSQVAEKITAAIGRTVEYAPASEEAFVQLLQEQDVPQWNNDMLVSLTRIIKLGMADNVTKAVEYVTGKPARTFDDFVAEHAAVWK